MVIQIRDVVWERGSRTILKGLDWTVKRGEHWCILGLNGSGKTSLLNMINGYIWPTSGSISVLDRKFGEYDLRELRKEIGWASSSMDLRLYGSDSALKIVLSGKNAMIGIYEEPLKEDKAYAEHLLNELGCAHLAEYPYDALSQGERQRIVIARALMTKPKLLILDEPCSGLDVFAREQLLAIVQSIAEQENGPALIYVTHHVEEILPCFTKSLLMKDGEVFAQGTTSSLMTSSGMSDFFGVPVEVVQQRERYWLTVKGEEWKRI
ncbi:ABC transporter ATP-binding protein [Paenibacillus chungangensis]|uniref:ABC transporter ATP-binding protein n=1 Tax=Paenibacillus chungangensis TaxID=696535 RepID=A0ABW3HMF4_9BACL